MRRGGLARLIAIGLAAAAAAVLGRNGGAGEGEVTILPEPAPSPASEAPRCPDSDAAADEGGCKAARLLPAKHQDRLTAMVTVDVEGR